MDALELVALVTISLAAGVWSLVGLRLLYLLLL